MGREETFRWLKLISHFPLRLQVQPGELLLPLGTQRCRVFRSNMESGTTLCKPCKLVIRRCCALTLWSHLQVSKSARRHHHRYKHRHQFCLSSFLREKLLASNLDYIIIIYDEPVFSICFCITLSKALM